MFLLVIQLEFLFIERFQFLVFLLINLCVRSFFNMFQIVISTRLFFLFYIL